MSFRDRFFTRRVARAITSPSAILLAGAGTAGTILAVGLSPAAPIVGAALFAARVAMAMDRKQRPDQDLSGIPEPWRSSVMEALDARERYTRACAGAAAGPLRDRLVEIGRRLDDGVEESFRIARRGTSLESALRQLDDPEALRQRLDAARRSNADSQIVQSIQAQLDSTDRIRSVASQAQHRLQLLDARLDEAVARAVELSLSADTTALGGLGSDVDAVVGDMEALRQALEETSRPSTAVGP